MSDILLGVIVFSSVILLLVIILNVLGDVLLPQGEVTLLINNDIDKSINVQTGGTVLSALAAQTFIYHPHAEDKELVRNVNAKLLKVEEIFYLRRKHIFHVQTKKIIGD